MTNIFLSFVGISVSISLIVAALILLTPFLNKRYAAKWKYWIWIFLALRLIIPFSGTGGQSVVDALSQMKTQTTSESEKHIQDTPDNVITPQKPVIVEVPTQMTTPIEMPSEKSNIRITLLDIVVFVWMIGSLIFISIHLISYLHYKKQVTKRRTIIKDDYILQQLLELKRELHIKRTVHVVEYPEAASPMIIGFLKPVLVLPEEQYSSEELFFILKHELVHLKRGDVYFKLLFVAANAVHWFNPLIWIMQKEAAIDMELACDERVTQGTSYAVRKAYTETLLSTLHKQCTKRTVLSTQFYGGKQVMKKRFKNILIKTGKKNGAYILICAVILAASLGALIGCSINESNDVPDIVWEKAEELVAGWYAFDSTNHEEYYFTDWRIESLTHCYTYEDFDGMVLQVYQLNHEFLSDKPENIILAGGTSITEDGWVAFNPNSGYLVYEQDGEELSFLVFMSENDCFPGDEVFSNDLKYQLENIGTLAAADNEETENVGKTALKVMREGGMDEIPATLFTGYGYSIYLTDGSWQQYAPDAWLGVVDGEAVLNGQVQLRIDHYEYKMINQLKEELADYGYILENSDMARQDGEIVYKVRLNELENYVWAIFYSYPVEAEEGWGAILSVIVDTFALSQDRVPEVVIESGDIQEIKSIIEEFSTSYFSGDANALQRFLTSPYEWDIDVYEGTGTAGDFTIKGLPDVGEWNAKNKWEIWLEFMDSNDDSYTYLTFSFIKQEGDWKIQSYGLEK